MKQADEGGAMMIATDADLLQQLATVTRELQIAMRQGGSARTELMLENRDLRQQLATARQGVWEEVAKEMESRFDPSWANSLTIAEFVIWCREQAHKETL